MVRFRHIECNEQKSSACGFTLVEVCIAILIVALGFLFISRAYSSVIKTIEIATDYTYALNLYNIKLQDMMLFPEKIPQISAEGVDADRFRYALQRVQENEYRDRIDFVIMWKTRNKSYDLGGFFYAAPLLEEQPEE